MRFLVFSDIHVHNYKTFGGVSTNGMNGRASRCLEALNNMLQHAIENKIKLIVFCGDWFVPRKEVDIALLNSTVSWINKLKQYNIELIMVEGNHDQYSGDKDGLYVLEDIISSNYSNIIRSTPDKKDVRSYDDCNFLICPFFDNVDGLHDYLDRHLEAEYDQDSPFILLAHTPVFHAKTPSGYKFPFGFVLDEEIRQYFLAGFFGDNHKYQNLIENNTDFYSVGSLLQHDFGDEGQRRGFLDVTIKDRKVTIDLVDSNMPEFFVVSKVQALGMERDNFNYHRVVCDTILSADEKTKLNEIFDDNFEIIFKYDDIFDNDETRSVETLAKKDLFEKYMKDSCIEGVFKYKGSSLKETRLTKMGYSLFGDTE